MCSHIKKTVDVLQISSKQQVRMCNRDRPMFLLMVLITVLPEFCDCGPGGCANHFYLPFLTESLGTYCEETVHSFNCSVGVSNSHVSSFNLCTSLHIYYTIHIIRTGTLGK